MLKLPKKRFLENPDRHPDLAWETVEDRLRGETNALAVLLRAKETPSGRRSLCYDEAALRSRKKNPPAGSALAQAEEIGAAPLTESLYRRLQELGEFDCKTSSWIATPESIRRLGGALFCERRYGTVFTFHNGADSYYSVRGWRGYICV